MRKHTEHEGRAGAELVLATLALWALVAPLAWADDGRVARRRHADALGREVLVHATGRPPDQLRSFRLAPDVDHRISDHDLTPRLAGELARAGLEARLYVDASAGLAWLDLLDTEVLRASGDPLKALVAYRAQRTRPVTALPVAARQAGVRDASL